MNVRIELIEIKKLLEKAQKLTDAVIASQEKPKSGKPPEPEYSQRVACCIWNEWEKLKQKGEFTVRDAKALMTDPYCKKRSESAYSSILSRWAREGYIDKIKPGSGPRPAKYKISN